MQKNPKTILLVFLLFFGFANIQTASCQDPPPPSDCTPGNPDFDEQNCIPLDGGLAMLLAAGAAYGIKKYRPSQKGNRGSVDTRL